MPAVFLWAAVADGEKAVAPGGGVGGGGVDGADGIADTLAAFVAA